MSRARTPRGVRAVLFDLAGTLTTAISSVQRNTAHQRVADALGVAPDAYLEVLLGSYFDRASGRRGTMEQTMRWVARCTGANPTESQLIHACALRRAAERAHLRPRGEAVRVLAGLRSLGVRTAVVSDCTHEVPTAWPMFPLAPYVDAPVFSIEVGACKPDQQMYATACRRLGVPPERCLYVGDGGSRELTGARQAGMTAIRLVAEDSARHAALRTESGWDGPVIRSLTEVLSMVAAPPVPRIPLPRAAERVGVR
ncbi:MAG: HAD family hydrolase [Micromonosporaceae bacterium]